MPLSISIMIRRLLQLLSLVLGCGLFGWGLSAFHAVPLIWLGTGCVMGYLLWVGQGGIFPASVWITVLISLAIAFDLIPPFWPDHVKYRYWAMGLILIWAAAVGIMGLLGYQGDRLSRDRLNQRLGVRFISLGAALIGLELGRMIYQSGGLG